jgi:hypothetical protein
MTKVVTAGGAPVPKSAPVDVPDMRDAESRARMAPPTPEQAEAMTGLCTGRFSVAPERGREPIIGEDGNIIGTSIDGVPVDDNEGRTGQATQVTDHSGQFGGGR